MMGPGMPENETPLIPVTSKGKRAKIILEERKWVNDWTLLVVMSSIIDPSQTLPWEQDPDPWRRYRRGTLDLKLTEIKNHHLQIQKDSQTARMKSRDKQWFLPIKEPKINDRMRLKAIYLASMLTDYLGSSFSDVEFARTGRRPGKRGETSKSEAVPTQKGSTGKMKKKKG